MGIKVGDKVRFLNDVGGGKVTRVVDRMRVMVLNDYGFEVPAPNQELVVIEEALAYKDDGKDIASPSELKNHELDSVIDTRDIFYPDVAADSSLGSSINMYLAFEPQGKPGNSDLNVYLINDSNYNVLYSIINTDENGNSESNAVGVLEANTKELFEKIGLGSVNQLPDYVFHLLFYQKGKFLVKEPVVKLIQVNPVRFYKEKAYEVNDFFDTDSLIISIYSENALANGVQELSEKEIKKIIDQKEKVETKPAFQSPKEKENVLWEIDLHIHELLDDFRGLSNGEILEVQMDHFKSKLLEAQQKHIKKVVFIHGVGNGVLKQELRKELDRMKKVLTYQDASFKEYGYGATLVQLK